MQNQAPTLSMAPAELAAEPAAWSDGPLLAVPGGDALALAFVLILAVLVLLEHRRPFLRPGKQVLKKSYGFNVITFLLNDFTLSLLSLPTLYLVADSFSGFGLLSDLEPGFLKFAIGFVLLDLTLYAWHYAMHHDDGLWTFHRVHHADRSLNVTTGLRFHTGELVLEIGVRCLFIVAAGLDAGTVLACQGVVSLFVLLHHANLRLPCEQALSRVFVLPRLHRVHHSVLREEHDSNYGAVFSVWDWLFGTLKEQEPTAIGLPAASEPGWAEALRDTWHGLAGAHKLPVPIPVRANQGGHKNR
jgi:sterol desaturase/sphingolipid hydroxylase (fatty acid hydroxylase superfamily)